MTVELDEILSDNQVTLQKNEEFLEQIATCASRQGYVRDALAESERIAQEIMRNAELRVDKILDQAQRALIPQQEHIACVEKEIMRLLEEMDTKAAAVPVTNPIGKPYAYHDFSMDQPQYIDIKDRPQEKQSTMSDWQIEARRGFSMREPLEQNLFEIKEISQAEHGQNFRPISGRQFSMRTLQEQNKTDIMGASLPEQDQKFTQDVSERQFSMREPQEQDNPEIQTNQPEFNQDITIPISERQFSMREPQEQDSPEVQTNQPKIDPDITIPVSERQFSLPEPGKQDAAEVMEVNPTEEDQDILKPMSVIEVSSRESQDKDIPDISEIKKPELDQVNSSSLPRREFSLRVPQNLDINDDNILPEPKEISAQAPREDLTDFNLPETKEEEEISNYNLAMSLMEQNETDMHLDVFVDTRYVTTAGEKTGQMQRHSWQVKILVEVPLDNQKYVGYGKVSSAVTSTLLRFDDVVLNDVYPFGIIPPDPENIAMYFFNCIQDTVSLLDLGLKEIAIWENQIMVVEVSQRNTEFDDKLQQGDDILHDIRSLLAARDGTVNKSNSRGRFGNIFKNT